MDEAGFQASQIRQDAVIRNIEIIGEAGRNILKIDPALAAKHAQLRLERDDIKLNRERFILMSESPSRNILEADSDI